MNNSPSAEHQLRVAGHAKDATKRLAWGFFITGLSLELLLGAALIDYWLILPVFIRITGLVLLLSVMAAALAGWISLRRRPTSMKEVALEAEKQISDSGCVVSTSAEYIGGGRVITQHYEPELVAALQQQAAMNLQTAQLSYKRRLWIPAMFLAFSILTILAFIVVAPVATTAFKRTLMPWSKAAYTRLEVNPGNAEVPVGSDLEITSLFSGRIPKVAALRWEEIDKPGWHSVVLKKSDDLLYAHSFKNLQHSFRYQILGNDAASEIYEIATYVPPEVRGVQVDVTYPDYTRVGPFSQTNSDAAVLRGSELTFRVTASPNLSQARLRFSSLPAVNLVASGNDQWVGHFNAITNTDYWIELTDSKGHRGGNEQPHHLKVLPDRPPKIQILEPGKDIRAEATNTISLRIAASDDFGVNEIKIIYHRLGGQEQVLNCPYTNTESGELMARVELPLAGLNLKEYEVVAYRAEVKDNNTIDGPGKGVSPVYFIEITDEQSVKSMAQAKAEEQKLNLLALQKKLIAETTALNTNASAEKFQELASRQKEAMGFAGIYRKALTKSGASPEAVQLLNDAVREMKNASSSLAQRTRDPAIASEEKALGDLYQALKALPKLENMPLQPPQEAEAKRDRTLNVALEAIKKRTKQAPPAEEAAKALAEAKQLSQSQADLLAKIEQAAQAEAAGEGQSKEQETNSETQKKARAEEKNKDGSDQKKSNQAAAKRSKAERGKGEQGEGKQGKGEQGKGQEGEGEQGQGASGESKAGEQKPAQEAKAASKSAEGKEGQEGHAGAKAGGGKQARSESQPGEGKENQASEKLAELEEELSKEATALAETLEKLANKDARLGHNAAEKASQAAGQMGASAQALRKGDRGAAGTEGGQGLQNLDKVVTALERISKDPAKLSDVTTEDFPKEYEALISEYLRKLSHER